MRYQAIIPAMLVLLAAGTCQAGNGNDLRCFTRSFGLGWSDGYHSQSSFGHQGGFYSGPFTNGCNSCQSSSPGYGPVMQQSAPSSTMNREQLPTPAGKPSKLPSSEAKPATPVPLKPSVTQKRYSAPVGSGNASRYADRSNSAGASSLR